MFEEEGPWNSERETVVRSMKQMLQEQGTGDLFDPDRNPRISKPPSWESISSGVEPFDHAAITKISEYPDRYKQHQCTECGEDFFSPFERDYHRLAVHGKSNEWQDWVSERERDADMKQILYNRDLPGIYDFPSNMQNSARADLGQALHPAYSNSSPGNL